MTTTRMRSSLLTLGLCGCMGITGQILAAEPPGHGGFDDLAVLHAEELDGMRGRDGEANVQVESSQNLQATVNGASFQADAINSGDVSIAEHALDNFAGVGLFNIVTGNNNAVDAAIGVTFNLQ